MDFVEMDFIDDAERSQPEQEIEMILQSTRVDMTRLAVIMDEVAEKNTYKNHIYYHEVVEVIALLLDIYLKNKNKENNNG